MLVINFETIKEKFNDYFISRYYIADSLERMLKYNDWSKIWESRKIKYTNKSYADFDVLDHLFQSDTVNLQYLTWVDSNFGKIDYFLEFFDDFYVSKSIDRKKMREEIEKGKNNNSSIFLFEFSPVTREMDKKEMV